MTDGNPQKGHYNEADNPEELIDGQTPPLEQPTVQIPQPTSIAPSTTQTTTQPIASPEPSQSGSITDEKPSTPQTYDDILGFVENYMKQHTESDDERKKREKREKARQIITGIADMGRALSNLYYTSRHAPSSYSGEVLSEKIQQRIDKAKAERDKERDWHLNYAMNLAKLKQGDQNFHFQQERARATDEHNKAQQEYRDKQLDLYYQREERMQQEADRKERMADWQKEYQQGQLDLKKAQIELRKWIEQGKMSRAQINHNLASWKRTKRYILDDKGKKIGEEEERIVMNPDGTLTTESSIKYDDGQGGGSSQQGGRKANPMGGGQSGTGGKKKNPMG